MPYWFITHWQKHCSSLMCRLVCSPVCKACPQPDGAWRREEESHRCCRCQRRFWSRAAGGRGGWVLWRTLLKLYQTYSTSAASDSSVKVQAWALNIIFLYWRGLCFKKLSELRREKSSGEEKLLYGTHVSSMFMKHHPLLSMYIYLGVPSKAHVKM